MRLFAPVDTFRVMAVAILMSVGCSESSDVNAPPDASIAYAAVAKDAGKYQWKRVKWFGKFAQGSVKKRTFGNGSTLRGVFVDTRTDLRTELRAFAVEAESEKGDTEFMFDLVDKSVWVIGTVAGSRNVKLTVGPPPEERELDVPLLSNCRFDPAGEPSS